MGGPGEGEQYEATEIGKSKNMGIQVGGGGNCCIIK